MYALFYLSCLLLQAGEDCSSLSSTSVDSSNSRTPSPSQSELSSSDIDIDSFLGPEHRPCNPSLLTYRLVGDNIDKNVKPRNMTSEYQTRSLHYFHSYAVRDRIDLSGFSSDPPTRMASELDVEALLPTCDDEAVLHENMAILMGRILRKNMPFFEKFATGLGRHIFHEHYDDLSTKSEVVRSHSVK